MARVGTRALPGSHRACYKQEQATGAAQTSGAGARAGRRPAAVRQVSAHSGPPSLPTCRPGPSQPAIKGACLRPTRTHRCSASPIIRETQVRATRSHLTHGFYEETKQALGRMWRNRTPVLGRRECKSARSLWKTVWRLLKQRHRKSDVIQQSHSRVSETYRMPVLCSIPNNSYNVQATQVSASGWTDKPKTVRPDNGMLFGLKKKGTSHTRVLRTLC